MSRLSCLALLLLCGCLTPIDPPSPVPPPPPEPTPEVRPVESSRHVLIWRETNNTRIPEGELQQFYGPELRNWLDAKIGRGNYRIWDQNIVIDPNESASWRQAAERRPTQVPWIVIGSGKKAHEGPLPATAAETIALLEKYLP